ncbi:MAG: acetyl-CoA hydrolase [Pseudomonadales bacterium]|nr:acetyl-CoA hydrolase [Pseudomonadales bacterium]
MLFHQLSDALAQILQQSPPHLRVAMPLGIGKPNPLINALYQHCKQNTERPLTLYTALSLLKPHGNSDLEQRFLQPFVERLYGNYPDLDYARDALDNTLPPHICVHEFFLKSGDWLHNALAQQHYISSNYTHIARDMAQQTPNVLLQAVAARYVDGELRLSLSCNPDLTMDVLEQLRANDSPCLTVAMINHALPYMTGTPEVPADFFDIVLDDPACSHTVFCTPNMAVSQADYAIGLHASSLVRDGGTLQIGIGSLGDAIAHTLLLRQQQNATYCNMLQQLCGEHTMTAHRQTTPFTEGLYGCSEMLVNGLLQLLQADIIKRTVDDGHGRQVALHGGFFLGPANFYEALRHLTPAQQTLIDMQRISFINQLYGDEPLKRQHRVKASFVNTCMMVTLGGAAVSDGLDDGQVVSGVGGQYNFVAMAHALPDAHSILMLRSTRLQNGELQSNIVPHYGHCTIPRHLRDIVITEYGIAYLRGKSDAEVTASLICIADARFQPRLREWAITQGKLPDTWAIPAAAHQNTPDTLRETLAPYREWLPDFPFGHDFTEDELVIVRALQKLKQAQSNPLALISAAIKGLLADDDSIPDSYLQRMGFSESDTLRTRFLRTLFTGNL